MNSSWQKNEAALSLRWTTVGRPVDYASDWIQETTDAEGGPVPPLPNFASHSLLGSGEWFAPWRLRWSVPEARPLG